MTEKIMVAVDGRPAGDRAVAWTAARAARRGAAVTVFQSVDEPPRPIGTGEHLGAMHRVADRIAHEATAVLRSVAPEADVVCTVVDGDIVDALEQATRDVALLVVGTNGWAGPLLPSTRAVRIAATAACPVVVVPDVSLEQRQGVVVGLDGSESSVQALAFAAAEADATGEPLVALTTWRIPAYLGYDAGWPTDVASELAEYAEERAAIELAGLTSRYPDLSVTRRVIEGSSAEALVAASADATLVVVGSRGLGPLRRLLLGSVSQSVVQHARGPVAVVR